MSSACLGACAPEDELSDGEEEESSRPEELGLFQQKTTQSNAEIFSWSKNQDGVVLRPVCTRHCFLTRLSGEMSGSDGSTMVVLHRASINVSKMPLPNGYVIDDNSGTWKLSGHSKADNILTAEATCVPSSDFRIDPGMVIWSSTASYNPILGIGENGHAV